MLSILKLVLSPFPLAYIKKDQHFIVLPEDGLPQGMDSRNI